MVTGSQNNKKLARDKPTEEEYRHSNWNTLPFHYKLRLVKPLHYVFVGEAPTALSYLTNKPCTETIQLQKEK